MRLRTIIVGCGYFGMKRLAACKHLQSKYNIIGLVETDRKRAAGLEQKYNIPVKSSITDYAPKRPDLAIISTPNCTHAPLALEALSVGMHLLCEKPLAPTSEDAQKIVKAARKYKRYVKTGSNHRFFPTVEKAYELLQQGAIGNLLWFRGSIGNNGSHTKQSWFWNPAVSGGGTFIDNGCHLMDIARLFMGDFNTVTGNVANLYWKKSPVEDLGVGIFTTKKGQQALITSSWIQWEGYMSFELWGDKGHILVDSKAGDTVRVGYKDRPGHKIYDFSGKPKNSYEKELTYLHRCITTGVPPKPDAGDGTAVIRSIEKLYYSAKKKIWIRL